jgi:secreted trypsin-like serine protease
MHRFLGLTLACLAISCAPSATRERTAARSDAIIAGQESGGEQDAVVLLYLSTRNQTCTGTMVAPNLLVTARHCVGDTDQDGIVSDYAPSDLRVFVGPNALSSLREDETKPATRGKELVVAPGKTLYPDVAFLVLEDSLATPVAAVRLSGGVAVGETLGVIGYGVDASGERPHTRMQRSGLVVSQIGPGRSGIGEPIMRGELVFGEAACSGDSGGPAFSEDTGALVAIASRVGNGEEPTADSPASFCVGETTDDIYTDFAPVAEIATRAFAAAGASPVLEDSVTPSKQGELASAKLEPRAASKTNEESALTGGGCQASPRPLATSTSTSVTSATAILLGVAAATFSRRTRRSTARARRTPRRER